MEAASNILLWIVVLALGFLLLGALRAIHRLQWRLDQLEATTPRRIGRDGVAVGAKAPAFELPDTAGQRVSLDAFRGQRLLIAFMQVGCGPCEEIVPRLNRLVKRQSFGVIAIVHGPPEEVRSWSSEAQAEFPVLVQESWDISKRYEVFATPFAFVLDADGTVLAKGIVTSGDYLKLLLADADERAKQRQASEGEEGIAVSEASLTVSSA